MRRRLRGAIGMAALGAVAAAFAAARVDAVSLDTQSEITLGIRTYSAARVGTEGTTNDIINKPPDEGVCNAGGTPPCQKFRDVTFPVSAAGHLRQSRFFLEMEMKHRLDPLIRSFDTPYQFGLDVPVADGYVNYPLSWFFNAERILLGPLQLLDRLPFKVRNVGYTLVFRAAYDGVYDYGPAEYRTNYQYHNPALIVPFGNTPLNIAATRGRLRDVASHRERLFQAFVEGDFGDLFLRFGRQILAWGETDVFRLLDNINPIDNSFGGFLIPLDERRVPLDMLRASYAIPHIPGIPFYEMFLEGFGAIDKKVAFDPGIPQGSPWQLPNFAPSNTLETVRDVPAANFHHARGGVQFKFSTPMPLIQEAQFGIAHYYTYLDTPAVQTFVSNANFTTVPPGQPFPAGIPAGLKGAGFQALAVQSAPTVQVSGASSTFSVPADYVRYLGLSGEPIVRTELAYFHNEARFTQSQLDPFVYAFPGCGGQTTGQPAQGGLLCTGGRRTGDSWNYVLGLDLNQFIRPLNENQSFFISTQFFYKHLKNPAKRVPLPIQTNIGGAYLPGQPHGFDGEVLPVPAYSISPDYRGLFNQNAVDSIFVHNPIDQFLQTLLIATSYYSGQVNPALAFFFDWSGAEVVQPQITLSRDPFRFTFAYSYLTANTLKGASGISLLRDRDNVLFQLEFVL